MLAITADQFDVHPSRGASNTALYIVEQDSQRRQRWLSSYTFGQQLSASINELYGLLKECQQPNWDGYGALPVRNETYDLALQFLEALPLGTPAPSLGAEPDGHITFEWYRSPRRLLSISVSPMGELHFAALIGNATLYGTEPFYGAIPTAILNTIRRIVVA
jgi:hypothetical protein